MFKFFHKDNNITEPLQVVAAGEVIELSEVSDPVFSQKMMGEGFGVHPTAGEIYAPTAGKITMVADTKHGLGLTSSSGLEILLHMGIDTVELKGVPFKINVNVGEEVQAGQLLGQMNIEAIESAGKDPTIMVVITNTAEVISKLTTNVGNKTNGDVAAEVTIKS
ncbi:MAG: PTS glucose transporter subunit IIA [Lactobacillus sp.]|uniref:PTS sugar transporter subunit IIA n=1 Tax=Bombilactobacillus bombi TaxID=1303590 RepID=UPI000E5893B2|nr:PTS glucose transporter subunit IIA [Bombilactobacillus bombi]AXX64409.1 PTS glucose transporter subunit IIA [Bombilactobacillus bombi]MCO6543871.1 PTS glucose transporter subunit IIA [Lactobacillus sp.]